MKGENYLDDKDCRIVTHFHFDPKEQIFKFTETSITHGRSRFTFQGEVQYSEHTKTVDLQTNSEGLKLEELANLTSGSLASQLGELNMTGKGNLSCQISGGFSKGKQPKVDLTMEVTGAKIVLLAMDHPLKNLKMKFSFLDNGNKGKNSSSIKVTDATFDVDRNHFKLTLLTVNEFLSPKISCRIEGKLNLRSILKSVKQYGVESLGGSLATNRLDLELRLINNGNKYKVADMTANGVIKAEGLTLHLSDQYVRFEDINGDFELRGQNLIVTHVAGTLNNTELQLESTISNFLAYLISSPDGQATATKQLMMTANIRSPYIDINKLFPKKKTAITDTHTPLVLPANATLNLTANVEQVVYRDFLGDDVELEMDYVNQIFNVKKLDMNTMNGRIEINSIVNVTNIDDITFNTNITAKQVDIDQLFYQCGNFGQSMITREHLEGKLDAAAYISSTLIKKQGAGSGLQNYYMVKEEDLYVFAVVSVDNGELVGFEPIERISAFINIDALKHIRFSKLENTIVIENKKVHIPAMDIKSSAINLTIAGDHGFDNVIDYKVKIRLRSVIASKFKRNKNNKDEIEDDKEGGIKIYLTMTGPIDDLKIRYDRKTVNEKIKQDFKDEKAEVIQIFKDEFSNKPDIPVIEDWEEEEEAEFIDWGKDEKEPD
ncbi:MAG: hypothetical protein IIA45_02845 [Bacteroidetes bacterium]|nr:hypothetical protein [Bacteroidota bacterium]